MPLVVYDADLGLPVHQDRRGRTDALGAEIRPVHADQPGMGWRHGSFLQDQSRIDIAEFGLVRSRRHGQDSGEGGRPTGVAHPTPIEGAQCSQTTRRKTQ